MADGPDYSLNRAKREAEFDAPPVYACTRCRDILYGECKPCPKCRRPMEEVGMIWNDKISGARMIFRSEERPKFGR